MIIPQRPQPLLASHLQTCIIHFQAVITIIVQRNHRKINIKYVSQPLAIPPLRHQLYSQRT